MAKMKICGLQKTTLLDYPGKVAATVFLGGCNLRCPFCHNKDLLGGDAPELMSAEELLTFLKRRQGVLEGVCVTGGEPTLWPEEAADLMRRIKELGYLVKLDTNGCRPQVLMDLCAQGLTDYVAMDIKAGRWHYAEVCGAGVSAAPAGTAPGAASGVSAAPAGSGAVSGSAGIPAGGYGAGAGGFRLASVEESAAWLMEGHVPYEFRTTTVKGLHTADDFTDIAAWIGGCERYFIQGFVDSGNVLKSGFSSYKRAELDVFLDIVKKTIPNAEIRGVDY